MHVHVSVPVRVPVSVPVPIHVWWATNYSCNGSFNAAPAPAPTPAGHSSRDCANLRKFEFEIFIYLHGKTHTLTHTHAHTFTHSHMCWKKVGKSVKSEKLRGKWINLLFKQMKCRHFRQLTNRQTYPLHPLLPPPPLANPFRMLTFSFFICKTIYNWYCNFLLKNQCPSDL